MTVAEPPSEETLAECPFRIEYPDPSGPKRRKKGRTYGTNDAVLFRLGPKVQASPFLPKDEGEDPRSRENQLFLVQPAQKWTKLTKYKNFVLNEVKYLQGSFVSVANSATLRRPANVVPGAPPDTAVDRDWLAYILEIRASDANHVYARVYWMYQPDDLPQHRHQGKRCPVGRQPYHGADEVIASNHMDIINVISVTGAATISHWDEGDHSQVQPGLYWRQVFDIRRGELSSAQPRCSCLRPENPDKTLLQCPNVTCHIWLHDECLTHAALMRTWESLGPDKPRHARAADVQKEEPEALGDPGVQSPTLPDEDRKKNTGVSKSRHASTDDPRRPRTHATRPAAPASTKRKRPPGADTPASDLEKPYLGLFEAMTRNSALAPVAEIHDLRPLVVGGVKSWLEPLRCLVCDSAME